MRRRRVIGLGEGGELLLDSPEGRRRITESSDLHSPVAYLVLDCSGSMSGKKLEDAKKGGQAFAEDALRNGYLVGLVSFSCEATIVCKPQWDVAQLVRTLAALSANGSTNMAAAFNVVIADLSNRPGKGVLVLVTDGQPNDHAATVEAAKRASMASIRIVTIGTDDADADFLALLATDNGLSMKVESAQLAQSITNAARLLPR